MKKIAAALSLLIPFAYAHADSSVTIYGLIDAAVSIGSGGNGAPNQKRLDSGVGPGTRLGFKGREDLGDGLAAIFDLQMGMAINTGALQQGGLAFGRQAFIGLQSVPLGLSLTAGRQYSPTEIALTAADPMAQTYWGNNSGIGIGSIQSPNSTAGTGCHGYTARINNSIQGSWAGSGLVGRLMVGTGAQDPQGSGRLINPSIAYSNGPVALTAAYTRFRQCAPDITAGASPAWQSDWTAGGSYDFGVAKLYAGYYNFNPAEANKTITGTTNLDYKSYWIGTRIPVGQGSIIALVTREQQRRTAIDAEATVYGLAYEHNLSKRTRVYVSGGKVANNNVASFGLVGATATQAATGPGAKPRVLSLGMTHSF